MCAHVSMEVVITKSMMFLFWYSVIPLFHYPAFSSISTLARKLLDAIHFPGCPSGSSVAPQTFPLTAASYSRPTRNHYIQYALSNIVMECSGGDSFKVPHGHIKVPKWHLKGPLVASKEQTLLFYFSLHTVQL